MAKMLYCIIFTFINKDRRNNIFFLNESLVDSNTSMEEKLQPWFSFHKGYSKQFTLQAKRERIPNMEVKYALILSSRNQVNQ